MATDFLNDARREIEGRTEDFYGELKAFYQGNAKAEQNLMEQTTQPFWQSLCLSGKRLQQRDLTVDMEMQEPVRPADYDGPKKDGYDYTCHRTKAVKMRRTYYRKGKKIATLKTPEIVEANFLKADVQGIWRSAQTVVMKENYPAISMAVMPAEQSFWSVISRRKYPASRWKRTQGRKAFPTLSKPE